MADPAPEGDPVTVCPLHVAHPLGETLADPVTPLGVACPETDAKDADGLGEARVDAVDDTIPEGDTVPIIDRVGDPAPEGEPVTVCPLQVAHPLGETDPDHVTPLGVAWPEAEPQLGLGVADPWSLEVGDTAPEGDPVTVSPLHVADGVSVPSAVWLAKLGVACADAEIPLGLPVGVEGRVGVAVVAPVAVRPGVPLPVLHSDTLTEAVEL